VPDEAWGRYNGKVKPLHQFINKSMSKILVTSGCSFSYVADGHFYTWPSWLYESLKDYSFTEHTSSAMGSQGNGMISRGLIFQVTEALKKYKPEDIFVAVMWSNSDRLDYYTESPYLLSWGNKNTNGWIENPTKFNPLGNKNWVIINKHWDNIEAMTYYRYFYSSVGSAVLSLEHILRVQYFLKAHNINYFFTDFMDNNIVTTADWGSYPHEVKHLWDLVDRNYYLPIKSCSSYIDDNKIGEPLNYGHPDSHQYKEFVNRCIMPYLKEKKYIAGLS